MNNPLVSIIIPNYNHSQFLDERIQSVLNQTYRIFELIILDDNSTDNSLEVINRYKDDSHVSHIVVNEENSGSSIKQWHKGFELAKGESNRADYYNGLVDRFLRHEWRSEERILLSYDVPWGKIMRNAVIQDNTVRFPQMTVGEDTVFSVTLATTVRHVKAYNQVMYVVTTRSGSLTTLDSLEMNREKFISSLIVNKIFPSVFTDSFLDKLIGICKTNRKECLWCLKMLVQYRVNPLSAVYRGIVYKWGMWRHSAKSC